MVAGARIWPFASECRNTATLDMIQQALEHTPEPIMIGAAPDMADSGKRNLYCFSKDAIARPHISEDDAVPCPPFPALTKWYGWMKIESDRLPRSFHHYRDIERAPDYEDLGFQYAIVYEYVPQTWVQDLEVAQAQLDFFYYAGFRLLMAKDDNWRQGKLVDFGDLHRPVDWPHFASRRRDASTFFRLKPGERPLEDKVYHHPPLEVWQIERKAARKAARTAKEVCEEEGT